MISQMYLLVKYILLACVIISLWYLPMVFSRQNDMCFGMVSQMDILVKQIVKRFAIDFAYGIIWV